MRDDVGDVVASTCLRLRGKFDVDIAKALTMRHTLLIALESGFRRVCVETDCLKLHNHISKGNVPFTEFGLIVYDIL
uniref:RNase H type-1 domain-containing protein n=1 Tax=Chenopodium quinoa TaxID=63459 RepID=A0A803N4T7_CHEQI